MIPPMSGRKCPNFVRPTGAGTGNEALNFTMQAAMGHYLNRNRTTSVFRQEGNMMGYH